MRTKLALLGIVATCSLLLVGGTPPAVSASAASPTPGGTPTAPTDAMIIDNLQRLRYAQYQLGYDEFFSDNDRARDQRFSVQPHIINGRGADIADWPWVASLQDTDYLDGGYHICGGSLIAPQWVLSAGHCFSGFGNDPDRVVLGQSRRSAASGQAIAIDRVVEWPFPQGSGRAFYSHDLVLVHLAEAADVARPEIEPIPLLDPTETAWADARTTAHIAGWGRTDPDSYSSVPDRLQSAKVKLATDSTCAELYGIPEDDDERFYYYGVGYENASMVCVRATPVPGRPLGSNVCHGDSGGPLVVFDPADRTPTGARLVGVTSFGAECASLDYPAVFADPAADRAAIDDIISGAVEPDRFTVTRDSGTGALTIDGNAQPNSFRLGCNAGVLFLTQFSAAGSAVSSAALPAATGSVECGVTAVPRIQINGNNGSDLFVLSLAADDRATIGTIAFDGGDSPAIRAVTRQDSYSFRYRPQGDTMAISAADGDSATSVTTSSATALALSGAEPDLETTNLEGVHLALGGYDDRVDLAGYTVPASIITGNGTDRIVGSDLPDLLDGGAREDVIDGGRRDDWIDARTGDDRVTGGLGDDVLMGGAGVDVVEGGVGRDTILWVGGDGSDRIDGGADYDTLSSPFGYGGGFYFYYDEFAKARTASYAKWVRGAMKALDLDAANHFDKIITDVRFTMRGGEPRFDINIDLPREYQDIFGFVASDGLDLGGVERAEVNATYFTFGRRQAITVQRGFSGLRALDVTSRYTDVVVRTSPLDMEQVFDAGGKRLARHFVAALIVDANGEAPTERRRGLLTFDRAEPIRYRGFDYVTVQ